MFSDDNWILICLATLVLALIGVLMRKKRWPATLNLVIFFCYSGIFITGLLCQSEGGSSLVWWFYLLLCLGIQALGLSIYLVFLYAKKRK